LHILAASNKWTLFITLKGVNGRRGEERPIQRDGVTIKNGNKSQVVAGGSANEVSSVRRPARTVSSNYQLRSMKERSMTSPSQDGHHCEDAICADRFAPSRSRHVNLSLPLAPLCKKTSLKGT